MKSNNVKAINNNEYAIEMINITKTFNNGKIIANKDITFRVKKNEIHAIVGENGAGKSTLMSILFGIYKQDSGIIKINNQEVNFKSANDANKMGLGMVHQHFKLVEAYSLLENIILGAEPSKFGFINRKKAIKDINELSKKYKLPINLNLQTSKASVGEQQRVEIIKLLYRKADILIFDEPTAVLSDEEIQSFLKMLLEFKKQGKTIILITHKLNEVKAVADSGTIIRLGKVVGNFDPKKTKIYEIAKAMIGKKLSKTTDLVNLNLDSKRIVLDIQNLYVKKLTQPKINGLNNFSLKIAAGEIYGLAGIEGNGQSELALAIAGIVKPISGSIFLNDKNKTYKLDEMSVKQIIKAGVSHVPEDRHKYGLILDENVAMNCISQQIDEKPFSKCGFLNYYAINSYSKQLCATYDVRGTSRGRALARSLSGGNQQKLVIAREISRPHKLIVYVQPTRGLDMGAIHFIHRKIIDDAKNGAAVLLISYELDEIFDVATRIGVIDCGKIVFESLKNKTDRSQIGKVLSRTAEQELKREMKGGK